MFEHNSELYKAWKHGKDGGSIFGAPVNGAFTSWAFSQGAADRAAASTPQSTYNAPSYTPVSGRYSGGSPVLHRGGSSGYVGGPGSGTSSSGGGLKGIVGLIVVGVVVAALAGGGKSTSTTSARSAAPAKPVATATSYDQGMTDRRAWETWFASLSGDTRAGANYWASIRNLPNHGTCAGFRRPSDAFFAGCNSAKQFFDSRRVDIRRNTEPDYWDGWNSL